ncbi:hypothetical protein HXA34_14340 [Salipaludibacillus agaradhaerens]|jgi:uncharacterized membrane-anchored protein YhcB (DUF1043 family)|uniref:hypothetical protein n=1 Tax=Salipaludibacillus agaradhaerens TaxID=76935 RepID=UPI0009983F01|nr:hypothetical protein [Salipaludibacillus agaradhaerens]MCR6107483.1 hypothetical protein [Salipaludibacillus agaradhaerens]MCR6119512.1 hypothetical protein [Salipaludibacillus agaradhaerens]UJW58536.1 hypothetical protein HXZ66_14475 [Bacillus sp. A116_S68]
MVETMLDFSLGPHGRFLSNLYNEHQLIIHTFVIGIVIGNLVFKRFKKRKAPLNDNEQSSVNEVRSL